MKSTNNTPRNMTNLDFDDLSTAKVLQSSYYDSAFQKLISNLVNEDIYECPYEKERMVATWLHNTGDSHGWHWNDYSLAVIWILKALPIEAGGVVQYIPTTNWDKDNPKIIEHLVNGRIRSAYFPSGSVYLMQTAKNLHRVHPILDDKHDRMILNFAFALQADLDREIDHTTVEELWS